jgi:apolipoprotein N-acyltransferase
VAAFQLAFTFAPLCWLVLAYLGCLFALREVATARQAFYIGMAVGLGVFVPQMAFLWTIFGPAAIPLWLILACFHGLFLLLLNRVEVRLGTKWAVWLAPVLWCGIEYFRSEVWWLRFAWFTAGSVPQDEVTLWVLQSFGVYAAGGAVMLVAVLPKLVMLPRNRLLGLAGAAFVLIGLFLRIRPMPSNEPLPTIFRVAGIQLEFPGPPEVLVALDRVTKAHPEAELLMLSEYTFDGPVPDSVKKWCQRNRKWLVAGGKELVAQSSSRREEAPTNSSPQSNAHLKPSLSLQTSAATDGPYYNTAFVISTNGEVVFTQAKSVPIQFFKDGEPALSQRVWDSPWGKLGIAICYDVSYRRVMDELIRQGAQALLIPTMDVEQWGEHQHRLNARMARLRAAEYGVPIFRVASSGISQVIRANGSEAATASFPGPSEMIAGELHVRRGGSLPLDRWLAPACTVGTGFVMAWLGVLAWRDRRPRKEAA